jgi:hypothetical protein
MSAPRVIKATFHDWRTVKGRKQLQLVFEVALEEQQTVLTMLGPPESSGSKWCAIALLDLKAAQARGADKHERSLAERCAILCNDVRFRDFLAQTWGIRYLDAASTDAAIKARLGIVSKTELNEGADNFNAEAAANFKLLAMTYESHMLDQKYADVRR